MVGSGQLVAADASLGRAFTSSLACQCGGGARFFGAAGSLIRCISLAHIDRDMCHIPTSVLPTTSLTMSSSSPSPAVSSQADRFLRNAVIKLLQPLADALVVGGLVDGSFLLAYPRTDPEVLGLGSVEPTLHLDDFGDAGGGRA